MTNIFIVVLSLSLSGSILYFLLRLTKPSLENRLSKKAEYIVFIIVVLRMLIPFSSKFNLFSGLLQNNMFFANNINTNELSENIFKKIISSDFVKILAYLWFVVFLVQISIYLVSYFSYINKLSSNSKLIDIPNVIKLHKNLKNRLNIKKNIPLYHSSAVSSPMIIGILNPVIYLPKNYHYDKLALSIILEHELTHYKRKDILLKWLSIFMVCVHWFNPCAFILKDKMEKLCELSCDEQILKNKSARECVSYGDAILSFLVPSGKKTRFSYGFSATHTTIKARLSNIIMTNNTSNKRILSLVILICFIILLLVFSINPPAASGVNFGAENGSGSIEIQNNEQYVSFEGSIVNHNNNVTIG